MPIVSSRKKKPISQCYLLSVALSFGRWAIVPPRKEDAAGHKEMGGRGVADTGSLNDWRLHGVPLQQRARSGKPL